MLSNSDSNSNNMNTNDNRCLGCCELPIITDLGVGRCDLDCRGRCHDRILTATAGTLAALAPAVSAVTTTAAGGSPFVFLTPSPRAPPGGARPYGQLLRHDHLWQQDQLLWRGHLRPLGWWSRSLLLSIITI